MDTPLGEKFSNYLIYQEPDLTHPLGRWSKDIKHIQEEFVYSIG